jgi:ABC-type lipoprotein export system ATPase subunit
VGFCSVPSPAAEFTAVENVMMPGLIAELSPNPAGRAKKAAPEVRLLERESTNREDLSGGEQRAWRGKA